jgi:hypothetical protein
MRLTAELGQQFRIGRGKDRRINEKMRSEVIPARILKRLEASNSSEQTGIEISAEFLRELQRIPGVCGANLSTLGNIETIPAAISAAGLGPL